MNNNSKCHPIYHALFFITSKEEIQFKVIPFKELTLLRIIPNMAQVMKIALEAEAATPPN
jgi:hypothetical protein